MVNFAGVKVVFLAGVRHSFFNPIAAASHPPAVDRARLGVQSPALTAVQGEGRPDGRSVMGANRWRRFADWDDRPLRLDRFAVEDAENGFAAFRSPHDPKPGDRDRRRPRGRHSTASPKPIST